MNTRRNKMQVSSIGFARCGCDSVLLLLAAPAVIAGSVSEVWKAGYGKGREAAQQVALCVNR